MALGHFPLYNLERLRECSCEFPAHEQSGAQHSWLESAISFPLCQSARLTIECFEAITSSVVGLGQLVGPSTILFRVGSVCVDSIQAVIFGAFANISKKCFETIFPCFGHGNSASSIIGIVGILGIETASFGSCPYPIFTGVTLPMSGESLPHLVISETAATLSPSSFQIASSNNDGLSAITATVPWYVSLESWFLRCLRQSDQASKSLAFKLKFHVTDLTPSIEIRHGGFAWL